MKVIVFDTETTGLPITKGFNNYYSYKELEKYNSSRLLSICWQVYEDTQLVSNNYFIINTSDFTIDNNSKSCEINGITQEIALEKGIDIKEVFTKLAADLINIERLVAHNINFDVNIILSELYRNNSLNTIKLLLSKNLYCTMINGKNIAKVTFKNSTNIKLPKLIELYKHFYNEEFQDAHNAEADVYACAKCYFKMV